MRRQGILIAAIAVFTMVVGACGPVVGPRPIESGATALASILPTATASTSPPSDQVTIRTFPGGPAPACDAIGVDEPVYGHLDGSANEPDDPVWLVAPDGTRMSIVWPSGFEAAFNPDVELRVAGGIVARKGDAVMFQVSRNDAAGTFADPYYASGSFFAGTFPPGDWPSGPAFTGCYPIVLGRGPAEWWIDPTALPLAPGTELIQAIVREQSCASGDSAEDRVLNPVVVSRPDAIFITFAVVRRPGEQTCEPNPPFPHEFLLGEPLGGRTLFDGSTSPPRDASTIP
jgi:hypothetical protein